MCLIKGSILSSVFLKDTQSTLFFKQKLSELLTYTIFKLSRQRFRVDIIRRTNGDNLGEGFGVASGFGPCYIDPLSNVNHFTAHHFPHFVDPNKPQRRLEPSDKIDWNQSALLVRPAV